MAKYIEQSLPCKLTEAEVQGKIRKLLTYKKELRSILAEEAAFKLRIKLRKEEVEPTIDSLEKEIAEETESRWVKFEYVYDTEAMTVATVRLDTYEQVGKPRAMTQEEIDRYVKIDLVSEAEKADKAKAGAPAPAGAGSDPQTRDEDEGTLAPLEGSGDPEALVLADDAPDGGKAPEEGQEGPAEGQDGPTPSLEAESPLETAQDGQEDAGAPAAEVDDWENIEPARSAVDQEEKAQG